ncbi:MAG: tetratricopeptide repeat protein [Xenococcaceae cyanobacterium]
MKKSLSSIAMGCLGLVLVMVSGSKWAQQPCGSELELRGIPLACYIQVGPKGIHPSVTSSTVELVNYQSAQWAEIALVYARSRQFYQAIALINNMEDYLTKEETLVEIADQLAVAGEYNRAKQLVETIEEYETYKAQGLARIARRYAEAGNNEQAEEMFSQALQFAQTLDGEFFQPRAIATIAIEYAAAGEWFEAVELAKTIQDDSEKGMALAGIAGALSEADQFQQGVQLAQTIQDNYYKGEALATIAHHARVDQLDQIVQLAKEIEDETYKVAALAQIAQIYARSGKFDKTAQLTETLASHDWLLPQIASEYARSGRFDLAIALANSIKNEYSQNQALVNIASEYAAAGEYSKALEFANAIASVEAKLKGFNAIAQRYAEAGKYRQALELFETIEAAADAAGFEAILYDIQSHFIPLVNCSLELDNTKSGLTAPFLKRTGNREQGTGNREREKETGSRGRKIQKIDKGGFRPGFSIT